MALLLFYASLVIGVFFFVFKRAKYPNHRLAILTLILSCTVIVIQLLSKIIYGYRIDLFTTFMMIILAVSCSVHLKMKAKK